MREQAAEASTLDGHAEHLGVAIGEDACRYTAALQLDQHIAVFGEGAQVPVLVHQALFGGAIERQTEPRRGIAQARARDLPERLVAPAHRQQARVVDLLVAPQQRQAFAVAGKELLGQQADAIDIEQGAVGVEQNGARGASLALHGRNLFATQRGIKCPKRQGLMTSMQNPAPWTS
jgi:hypothetical protein